MLHWLAGSKPPEPSDPDATGYVEPPETPAPVFAVRAFKHAIFGTPQTVQAKQRRNSNTENTRSRGTNSRTERPTMMRPKSVSDARALGFGEGLRPVPEAMASPTKGILVTPGAAAAKRKTVTFGEQVTDNEDKRPIKSGLPDDCPGKFPSPWTKPTVDDRDDGDEVEDTGRARPRSKLTEALEQVRDDSAKRKRSERRDEVEKIEDTGGSEPSRECCKRWIAQFDAYREKSQRDVRKLIQKQKMAKDFARDKDMQCTDLADQLRQERKKVDRLEKKTVELEAQLREMQQRLVKDSTIAAKSETVAPSAKLAPVTHQSKHIGAMEAKQDGAAVAAQPARLAARRAAPREDKMSERQHHPRIALEKAIRSSSPARDQNKSNTAAQTERLATDATNLTPLKSLNINTLPTAKLTRRDSAQPSPPIDRFAKEPLVRQEVVYSQTASNDKRAGSPLLPTTNTRHSDEPQLLPPSPRSPIDRKAAGIAQDLSIPMPASSPFLNTPGLSPVAGSPKRSYFDRWDDSPSKTSSAPAVKENIPLSVKPAATTEKVKPMAAWNAINAPPVPASRRTTSMTTRDGRQVSNDRLEAAKARMAARGRIVS
ncbi:Spindle pole body formation-associated protein [Teratosphaeria destructans]|uniref:Spindle pole body formation-associated protein n=1 Tax=Teratosphaeria destructans TaxID=418781 RepID=A0A9W7SRE3_9PEZI|nr:Spindle pole body formation-associated protein [Teratosphaeria destructans]